MNTHTLKTWPAYFSEIWSGAKTFEVRKNDRDYKVGDRLLLREFDPDTSIYLGREILAEVTYRLPGGRWGIADDMCVMSIKIISRVEWPAKREGQPFPPTHTKFKFGELVTKTKGSQWSGHVVGWYSTKLTPEGYAVESQYECGSVQIYPAAALEKIE